MTLIELLVAMAIGAGLTLAITSLLIAGENHKRTTTSTNDAEQTGNYAFYALDRSLRSAGSALADSVYPIDRGILGCKLTANHSGASILPHAGAFPAPFAAFLGGAASNLVAAPLLIAKGQSDGGSDALLVLSGSGSGGGVPRQITSSGSSTTLNLDNTIGFNLNDLVLVSQSGTQPCLLEQISTAPAAGAQTLAVASTAAYYTAGSGTTLAALSSSTSTYVTPIGNATANNVQFNLFGVGTDNTLYSYDLLQSTGADVSQPIADGVVSLRALYGVDTDGDAVQNTWKDPATAPYDITTIINAPNTPNTSTMRSIVSVRVALIVRGEYYDKNPVSPATLTFFNTLTDSTGAALTGLTQTYSIPAGDARHYRYRVFEFTVPLRNMLLLAGAAAP
jgi:type IV pilus assembly protein PilW